MHVKRQNKSGDRLLIQGMRQNLKRAIFGKAGSAIVAAFLLVSSVAVYAAAPQDQACDPDVMDAIDSRAYVEGAREHALNQNFIYKPDSVLEYSCFNKLFDDVVPTANSSFYMTAAPMTHLVFNPLTQYLQANYQHTYLGGRSTASPTSPSFCDAQAYVWNIALCINFYDVKDQDGFYDLTRYVSYDPRKLPPTLPACPATPYQPRNGAVDVAYNNRTVAWTVPSPNPLDTTDYIFDKVDLLNDITDYSKPCRDPIPTGLTVVRPNYDPSSYQEKFCSQPACYYDPTADQCVK